MTGTSILLGAGFSVNKGYPTANELNNKISNLDPEEFWIHTDGTVFIKNKDDNDPSYFFPDYKHKYFVTELIKYFTEKSGSFNYEEFYDFYKELYKGKEDEGFEEFCNQYREEYHIDTDNTNLLSKTNRIFNQLIEAFLVDGNGNTFYESVHYCKPTYIGYTGILNCLETLGKEGLVHIHTLNHDIFFESLNSSDWLKGELSDGFEEMGSKYYGSLKGDYKIRLPFFNNKYDTTFRLYKLHGSFDQFPFHIEGRGIDNYVKIKLGVGTTDLYKEVYEETTGFSYINDWLNYHPDFLSGTTSKILRYREPWYYEKVFNHFEKNLTHSKKLIIIGYGCGDSEINNLIEKYYDYSKYPIYVVDPYPSEQIKKFVDKFDATLVVKTPENLMMKDIE